MMPSGVPVSDRAHEFVTYRLNWLDQEITRYRDFEWRATSFNTAILVAVLYAVLDPNKASFIIQIRLWLVIVIILYLGFACASAVYIHMRLNYRRNQRAKLVKAYHDELALEQRLKNLVLPPGDFKEIKAAKGFFEGPGVFFALGFLLSMLLVALAALAALDTPPLVLVAVPLFIVVICWGLVGKFGSPPARSSDEA